MSNDGELNPLLAARWSPATFDPDHTATAGDVAALIEAARWAPSAGNSQPWAFIASLRGDETHARLVRHLTGSSRPWAPLASILTANLCHRFVEDTDWEYSEFASYDLGQAVAHMTVQAASLGLSARQFRAFDRDAVAAAFDIPAHWQVTTMTAFGRSPGPQPQRDRRASADLHWAGTAG